MGKWLDKNVRMDRGLVRAACPQTSRAAKTGRAPTAPQEMTNHELVWLWFALILTVLLIGVIGLCTDWTYQ